MTVVTITLSNKGQVVIPKEIRDELRWEPGAQLTVMSSPSGITIRALPEMTTGNLDLGLAVAADVGAPRLDRMPPLVIRVPDRPRTRPAGSCSRLTVGLI